MSENNEQNPDNGPSPIGEISQEPSAFEAFLDANQKKLMSVGILAILCLVAYVIVTGQDKMAKEEAAAAVAKARTGAQYQAVSEEYDGENAGGSAILLKSQLLWRDQQQQEAIEALETFVSEYPEHPALGSAYASLGSYQQQLKNLDEAKEAFEEAAETKSAASSLALLSLGDLALQAGDDENAEKQYKKIISDYESSHLQVKSMAQNRLKLINVESPTEKKSEPAQPTVTPEAATPPIKVPGIIPEPAPNPIPKTPTPEITQPVEKTTQPDAAPEPEKSSEAKTEPTTEKNAEPEAPTGSSPE
jgi:tetratricopeptide (TPR) repeat protein